MLCQTSGIFEIIALTIRANKDGTRRWAKVMAIDTKAYENHMNQVQSYKDFIKFRLKVDGDEFDELVEYNKIIL